MHKKTFSLCPTCNAKIPAEIIAEGFNVFMQKTCPEHGGFKFLVSKDKKRFFDKTYSSDRKPFTPCKEVKTPDCPADCGWCSAHGQHICTGLIEVTDACNMACPVCYFGGKNKNFITVEEFNGRLQTLLKVENGALDVLQISGGECTIHPRFGEILDAACAQKVSRVLINTNGLALLGDAAVYEKIKRHKDKVDIYLQFDGFDDGVYQELRARPLAALKEKIIKKLDADGIKICLAVTVYKNNLKEIKNILDLSVKVKNISGITFQRLTKQGFARGTKLPAVTAEDILESVAQSGYMEYKDIIPLPCSHENCSSIAFLFCKGDKTYSLSKFIDYNKCKKVLSNRIAFDAAVLEYMKQNVCKCFLGALTGNKLLKAAVENFAAGGKSAHKDMKIVRILVKNFMDGETFDFERAKKCCVGVSAGSGKIIPFCVYNNLKGGGHGF